MFEFQQKLSSRQFACLLVVTLISRQFFFTSNDIKKTLLSSIAIQGFETSTTAGEEANIGDLLLTAGSSQSHDDTGAYNTTVPYTEGSGTRGAGGAIGFTKSENGTSQFRNTNSSTITTLQDSTITIALPGINSSQATTRNTSSFVTNTTNLKTSKNNSASAQTIHNRTSPYAYVFMMLEVDPGINDRQKLRGGYHQYLADILIAAELFRSFGSQQDVVALISLVEGYDTLPEDDARLLRELDVRIVYFDPVFSHGGFPKMTVNKIEVLKLTEYRRVLYLDCDVIPLTNLDYMFELSETTMKPNILLATTNTPMIAGFFLLEPNIAGYQEATRLVQKYAGRHFDKDEGWGVKVDPEFPLLINVDRNMKRWKFVGGNADQGILYHYARYVACNMTQILHEKVVHYGSFPDGRSKLERVDTFNQTNNNPFAVKKNSTTNIAAPTCSKLGSCMAGPYCDHAHFIGKYEENRKPWKVSNPEKYRGGSKPETAMHLWWATLFELEERLRFNFTSNWNTSEA